MQTKKDQIWLVIEGDNGTGKDILASHFSKEYDFIVINYDPQAQQAEQYARSKRGRDRVAAFLEYNRLCARIAEGGDRRMLQIRYWPSTLAAAYADNILTLEQFQEDTLRHATIAMQPTVFLYLDCSYEIRIERVRLRNQHGKVDDISQERDERYRVAASYFSDRKIGHWLKIDSTHLLPKKVFGKTVEMLRDKGLNI